MDLTVSSVKPLVLVPDNCVSDPEEKEISDDDDDDRNHKHRRRDIQSQVLERDTFEQASIRSFRKQNKPLQNGRVYGRGRGRDASAWNTRGSRFGAADIASQIVQHGSAGPNLFAGRGMSAISNAQNASWGAFGLIPSLPSNGLDALHSLGLHGALRPTINSAINVGIPRKRCRDFDERGFCLRGDMCPMEHGMNRIVVEDVQSLSQFNLPVSLPTPHVLGLPAGTGPGALILSASTTSSMPINARTSHGRSGGPGIGEDDICFSGALPGSVGANGSDLYDPDQPLWNNDCPESSGALLSLQHAKVNQTESQGSDICVRHPNRVSEGIKASTSARITSGILPVRGRFGSLKCKMDNTEKIETGSEELSCLQNGVNDQEPIYGNVGHIPHGKHAMTDYISGKSTDIRSSRKQKAIRTLYINGIPQNSNRKEVLLSHFKKFGMIIDIYIPANSEMAFVQFSRREEAEAALKAPDAVMGNRFIKLWWANRDSIPDDGSGSVNIASTHTGVMNMTVPSNMCTANTEEGNFPSAVSKTGVTIASDLSVAPNPSKPVCISSTTITSPLQRKLSNIELLKEQLREKQEMLEKKRNDFKRQLDKLEKIMPAAGLKNASTSEDPCNKQNSGSVSIISDASFTCNNTGNPLALGQTEKTAKKVQEGQNMGNDAPTTSLMELTRHEQENPSVLSLASSISTDKPKLDRSQTSFKVFPPLPTGFTNEEAIRRHFSSYGDVINVELENLDPPGCENECSARIIFRTHTSAEQAFVNGKYWQGCSLQFMWLPSVSTRPEQIDKEKSPLVPDVSTEADVQHVGVACVHEMEANKNGGNFESDGEHLKQDVIQSDSAFASCSKETRVQQSC